MNTIEIYKSSDSTSTLLVKVENPTKAQLLAAGNYFMYNRHSPINPNIDEAGYLDNLVQQFPDLAKFVRNPKLPLMEDDVIPSELVFEITLDLSKHSSYLGQLEITVDYNFSGAIGLLEFDLPTSQDKLCNLLLNTKAKRKQHINFLNWLKSYLRMKHCLEMKSHLESCL